MLASSQGYGHLSRYMHAWLWDRLGAGGCGFFIDYSMCVSVLDVQCSPHGDLSDTGSHMIYQLVSLLMEIWQLCNDDKYTNIEQWMYNYNHAT